MQFMFECVLGLRGFQGSGCILADDMVRARTDDARWWACADGSWRFWAAGPWQDATGNHAAVDAAAPRPRRAAGREARHHCLPDLAGLQLVRCACGPGGQALTLHHLQGFRVREMAQGPCAHDAAGGVGTCGRHRKRDAVSVAAQPDAGTPLVGYVSLRLLERWLTRLAQVLIVSYETFRLHSVRTVRNASSGAILTLQCRSGLPRRQPATCSSATRRTG